MAKPAGTKLVIKNIEDSIKALNSGVTDKYKLFVIVESVKDAYELMTKADIHSVTLGGTGLLIVVGVALETYKQLESSIVSRSYKTSRKRRRR